MSLYSYLKESNEVYHTTIDPKGPGVVRIHLVPPKKVKPGVPWVVIINGYRILPILTSWAVILKELIIEINRVESYSVVEENIDEIYKRVAEKVKKIYNDKVLSTDIISDAKEIIDILTDIAYGRAINDKIGLFSLSNYYKQMYAPHRMDLMISAMEKNGCYNCNQKCLHCYAFGEEKSNVEELDTESWLKVIDKLQEIRVPQITFTGGEPTMRKDLVKLVDHARWFTTRLNTNGILLTKELCSELYRADLDSCQITFYSVDEEIHNELVGGNHYHETVEGIKNAIEAGLDVSINTPLCNLNRNYVDTIKFLSSLGVKYFTCSGLIPSGKALSNESVVTKLTSREIYEELYQAFLFAKDNELEIQFTSPGWIRKELLLELKMDPPSCGACLSNMAIAPNGDIIPCQSWLNDEALGNILVDKWKKVWESSRCKYFREQAALNDNTCLLRGNK